MSVAVVTTGMKFPEGPVALPDGEKTVVADVGGGPNGTAIGPDGRAYVANSGGLIATEVYDYQGGSIQAVDLDTGEIEVLYTECDGAQLRGPNDIAFDADGGFYFTDHGKSGELAVDHGHIYYAAADGSSIRRVATQMSCPNGICLSPDGTRLCVSETYTARVWWWDVVAPGEISGGLTIAGSGGGNFLHASPDFRYLDSLGVEESGNICVASLATPGICVISPEGELVEFVAIDTDGDPGITNICWGGRDMRTAFITASSTGKVITLDWPRPSLVLNNSRNK